MSLTNESSERNDGSKSFPARRRRIFILASHVIQYSSPLFRRMAEDPRFDLLIVYCSLHGAEASIDPEFGVEVTWDTPVLEGYPWVHLPNRSPVPGLGRFFGLLNPGLWKLIRGGHFDAAILPGYFYFSAWIAILAAKIYGVPIIFATDAHKLQTWATRGKWRVRFKKFLVRRIFGLGQAVLAGSSGTVQYLQSLGIPKEEIVLGGNVVDNDWWTEQAAGVDRDAVRRSWQIPADAMVTLLCAKLQPWKRPLDLLEAFGRANVQNSYLVVAGDGPLRGTIEQRAQTLGISDRIRMLGFVALSRMPSVYRASDLLVLPSGHESFGFVVNEAMLCGCLVAISDRVGAKYDLVRPGETGYVFPVGDVDALAAILEDSWSDKAKRIRMGAAARKRMETWSPRQYLEGVMRAVNLVAKDISTS